MSIIYRDITPLSLSFLSVEECILRFFPPLSSSEARETRKSSLRIFRLFNDCENRPLCEREYSFLRAVREIVSISAWQECTRSCNNCGNGGGSISRDSGGHLDRPPNRSLLSQPTVNVFGLCSVGHTRGSFRLFGHSISDRRTHLAAISRETRRVRVLSCLRALG